ncbi:hypothetical protein [uncultured Fibrobacter sp.]|uniref:hypothetical protein n=1 Tax=uncultured Fibrobacter sp. TaxID=261512 RepID=UPI0025ED78E7|nr:hypothetical protein [uncultured Fibrobacter sp.]
MTRLAIFILLVASALLEAEECTDFGRNSDDCLYQFSDKWPTYSDGTKFKEGRNVCIGHTEKTEEYEYIKQGIPVIKRGNLRPCRKIVKISRHRQPNFACCSNKYLGKPGASESLIKCDDDTTGIYCPPAYRYMTIFSEQVDYAGLAQSTIVWYLKDGPNVIRFGDTVEVFREDDGSMRYRGYLSIRNSDEPVRTVGFCYDRKGRSTRRVNDASLCK